MSFRNPTQIRLGMEGQFFNRAYRVAGRAVLGVMEGGRRYYWNEYYLESAGGASATLVFEETEGGCAWSLFTMFEPDPPLTAAEAAAKREGDAVELDGASFRVSRVDHSRVYDVEGKTPAGVEPGKEANYFNAEAGPREVVASWTGEEVEFYSGLKTSAPMVAAAFRLQGPAAWRFQAASGRSWLSGLLWLPAVLTLALIGIPFACFVDLSRSRPMPAIVVERAAAAPLRVGASGALNGVTYKITGRAVLEMAEVGRRWERQQYDLSGPGGAPASLLCDPAAKGPVWLLCSNLQLDAPLTPFEAGARRAGQSIGVDGSNVAIKELFRGIARSAEAASACKTGEVFFGFSGPISGNQTLLVQWNQSNVLYQQATPVPAKTILSAFGGEAGK